MNVPYRFSGLPYVPTDFEAVAQKLQEYAAAVKAAKLAGLRPRQCEKGGPFRVGVSEAKCGIMGKTAVHDTQRA